MKKISIFKENYYSIFLIFYFLIGIFVSMNVGITHDEPHSNWVWELNKKKLSNLFFSTNYDINYLKGLDRSSIIIILEENFSLIFLIVRKTIRKRIKFFCS